MSVQEIIKRLGLAVAHGSDLDAAITGGYASDLLSCAMAGAQPGNVWVTLQAHPNVVAVASLTELSAVIITEGVQPDAETVSKAQQAGVTLLTTPMTTYQVVAALAALGVEGASRD